MKAKRTISILLTLIMIFSCMNFTSFADEKDSPLYVNLGDSIANGSIENSEEYPEYSPDKDSYSGLFASYLGAERVDYSGLGMQTTDILYMIDDEFRSDVDSGVINPDSWHRDYYPPFNGTALTTVMENIKDADYISLCVGGGDVLAYPSELKSRAMEEIEDEDEAKARLQELLDEGQIDEELFNSFNALIKINYEKAVAVLCFALDIIEGYGEYSEYYPRIIEDIRSVNDNAVIVLVGLFIPGGTLSFLTETTETSYIVFYLNRLLDNINIVIKETALEYNCYYVDTMGIDSDWHPTVEGYSQICSRIVSVLEGDSTYAGSTTVATQAASFIQDKIDKSFDLLRKYEASRFTDIFETSVYFEPVVWATGLGITSGYSDGTFRPNELCTRAQAVTFLWRAAGSPEPTCMTNPFSDVSATQVNGNGNPYYKAILWAVEEGITTGYCDGTFRPDATVTRAQFVTFLWRYAGQPASSTGLTFTDTATIAKGYQDAVAWGVENGVIAGYGDNTFRPTTTCSRWQVVTFMYRDLASNTTK